MGEEPNATAAVSLSSICTVLDQCVAVINTQNLSSKPSCAVHVRACVCERERDRMCTDAASIPDRLHETFVTQEVISRKKRRQT